MPHPQAATVSAALLLIAAAGTASAQTFSADAALGIEIDEEILVDAGAENVDAEEVSGVEVTRAGPVEELERQDLITVGPFVRTCDCMQVRNPPVDDIRDISDEFCADGNAKSSAGLSNMVWGFGQFVDHDLTLTIENEGPAAPTFEIDTELDVMEVHRAITTRRRGCRNSLNVHTPIIDAGPVYGSDRSYLQNTLREPGTCRLRVAEGDLLPVTTSANENGEFSLIAGDVRVVEHAFLAAQHVVWVREHNRICEAVDSNPRFDSMSTLRKFALVQNVVIAKFQQVVLTEFLPALGITQADLEAAEEMTTQNGVSVEFSIAYRLGHDLIGNDVGGLKVSEAFDAVSFYLDISGPDDNPSVTYKPNANSLVSDIMLRLSTSQANEIDGKLSDALRNMLFGSDRGEDLCGRNIFRGRELGIPTYGGLARCFGTEADPQVEEDTPDAWLGLLREPKNGSVLPPTLRAIIVEQFHRSFFGRRGRYWKEFPGRVRGFVEEIDASTYAQIISANTGARVTGNVFLA